MEKINIFCLPFAGGSKYSYRELEKGFPTFINPITLEYPGRGHRLKEELLVEIEPIVDDLFNQMAKFVHTRHYAIYGHSMGGLIASLLVKKIIQNELRPPRHVFITGTVAPSAISRNKIKMHLLAKAELIAEIKEFNGCPDEILENEELLDFLEPILRADFTASENFRYVKGEPVDIPFTVIWGDQEGIDKQDILLWQTESQRPIYYKTLPGKHFFIFEHAPAISQLITNTMLMKN